MRTLIFINKFDPTFLPIALNMRAKNQEVSAVLSQDAVYITLRNSETASDLSQATKAGVRIYLLSKDVQKRGINEKLANDLNLIDYDQLVDLLAQEDQKVINL
jgi:sulfur relay protein TusB/DsrH